MHEFVHYGGTALHEAFDRSDFFYSGLDPSIRKLVRNLHHLGIETYGSCEGHLDIWRYPHPWITLNINSTTPSQYHDFMERLFDWNNGEGVNLGKWQIVDRHIPDIDIQEDDADEAEVFGVPKICVPNLLPINLNLDRDSKVLGLLQSGAQSLAHYLII